jgi:hypothetical protein
MDAKAAAQQLAQVVAQRAFNLRNHASYLHHATFILAFCFYLAFLVKLYNP